MTCIRWNEHSAYRAFLIELVKWVWWCALPACHDTAYIPKHERCLCAEVGCMFYLVTSRAPLWHYIYVVPIVSLQLPFSFPPHIQQLDRKWRKRGWDVLQVRAKRKISPHRYGRHQEILYPVLPLFSTMMLHPLVWCFVQEVCRTVVERLDIAKSMVMRRRLSWEKHAEVHLDSKALPITVGFLYWCSTWLYKVSEQ